MIIIQAIVHFGFIGRNVSLKEMKSVNEESEDEREPPLKSLKNKAFADTDTDTDNDNNADASALKYSSGSKNTHDSTHDSCEADSDLKFIAENNRTESEALLISTTSSELRVLRLGSDVPSVQCGDQSISTSAGNCNYEIEALENHASLETETVDSSYGSQDQSGWLSKSRSLHDSFSSVSASTSLEPEQEAEVEHYDGGDCDSIDDDDDEWRLQLLKDYYDNTTNFLKPTEDYSTVRSLEPAESINMLCEKLQRKRDDTDACINVNTLMASISVSAQ